MTMGDSVDRQAFFQKMIWTVSFFVFVYSISYLLMGAYASAILQISSNLIFTPLAYILSRSPKTQILARYTLIAASSLYIYAAPMGIRFDADADFYLIPNMFLPLLIFESHQKKEVVISLIFPFLTWFLIHAEIFPEIPTYLMPQSFPYEFFQHVNFIGTFILISIIIKFFIDYTENLKKIAVQDLLVKNAQLFAAEQAARKSNEVAEQERSKSLQNARLATLGELSAGIAHEMNNPLTIIAGNVSACLREPTNLEKIQDRLQKIENASQRIVKIIGGLRKFSRSAEHSSKQKHAISKLISEVVPLTEAKSKTAHVSVEVDCRTQSKILCDEVEFGQVLINLINNAVDAVKDNQEKWVRVIAFDQQDWLILQVWDSGKGIPRHIADKLFQAFFTTKPAGEGTGLGLSIIKGILEQHDATIELKQDESNTCFEIKFKKAQ